MKTVLITDGNQRKSLVAARAFGRAGWRVLVAEETAWQMTRFSRYAGRWLVSPSARDPERYGRWLVAAADRAGADLVLPMDDGSMAAAVACASALGDRVLVPGREQWEVARDKGRTQELARRTGVPAPAGGPAPELAAAAAIAGEVGYPVVIQARQESGGRGLAFVDSPADLPEAYRRVAAVDPAPLVKRRLVGGTFWDVCLIYDRAGAVRSAFVQRELRHFPLHGGTSTLQESVERPDLIELATRLLAPLGWTGVAEVEFLQTPDGRPWLMEINPRFWASVGLAVDCGVNFPLLTAALAAGEGATAGAGTPGVTAEAGAAGLRAVPGQAPYPVGRRCRWLLPGDILHYLANPERSRMEPSFWRTYDYRTRDDICSRDDPGAAFGFAVAALRQSVSIEAWRMLMRW